MPRYEFGEFVLDTRERLLRRGDERIALTPKVFETLELLVDAGGHLVERETFFARLWPNTTVEDRNLTVNISTLRKALGGDDSSYIETVPKLGYRLGVPVRVLVDAPVVPTTAPAEPAAAPVAAAAHVTPLPTRGSSFWSHRAAFVTVAILVIAVPAAFAVLRFANNASTDTSVPRSAAPDGAASAQAERRTALAVLPFVVSGGDVPTAFGIGLADAVIARLEAVPRIAVKRLREVAPYSSSDPAAIGGAVGADFVIEGAVQRLPDVTRARVRVIDVRSGQTRWTEEFVQPASIAYDVQDLLAANVSGTAMRHLNVERTWRRHAPPANEEALRAYLDARMHSSRIQAGADIRDAIRAYERAVALDPAFAPSWSGLGRARRAYSFSFGADHALEWKLAYEATHRALELDPTWPEGHQLLGMLNYSEWDWAGSERNMRKAVELDPQNDDAITWLANLLRGLARWDESAALYRQAREINPIGTAQTQQLGELFWHSGRHMEALGMLAEAMRLNPGNSMPHALRAQVYDTIGNEAEAITARRIATQLSGDRPYREAVLSAAPRGYRALRAAELDYARRRDDLWGVAIGLTYFGRHEEALDALDRCITAKCGMSILLATEPRLMPLHASPRFKALAARVNLGHLVPDRTH